jgi:hypothetical protein
MNEPTSSANAEGVFEPFNSASVPWVAASYWQASTMSERRGRK